ncbi:MAG TPA: hypothetical protein PK098_11395 [Phycisphaerales bacterium]|nr:hypothetical protein [Phycisphaerales bacterium]
MLTQLHHMIRTGGFMFMVVIAAMCVLGMERAASAQPQTITLRVDINNGSTTGDGLTWGGAMKFLQDAIAWADNHLTNVEPTDTVHIWVAAGTYRPDQGSGISPGTRAASFPLRNNVRVYGGFAGNEIMFDARDPAVHLTILSGDLLNSDKDNSRHVVIAKNVNHSAALDGFTIIGGVNAAVLVRDAQPRLMDCTIISRSGSAVRCEGSSFLALIRCVIRSLDDSCPIEVRDESEAVLVNSQLMPAMPEMIDLGEHDGLRGAAVRAKACESAKTLREE